MPIGISALAYALRVGSKSLPHPLTHGHALQLVAAALGHQSLAGYQTSGEEPLDLSAVRHVVVDDDLLLQRMHGLGYDYAEETVLRLVRDSLGSAVPGARIHWGEDLFADEMREFVEATIDSDDYVLGVIGATNGTPGLTYIPFEISLAEIPLGDFDAFTVRGYVSVDQDPERPYAGHRVDVEASIALTRLGRRCVGQPECSVDAAHIQYYEDDDSQEPPPAASPKQPPMDEWGVAAEYPRPAGLP